MPFICLNTILHSYIIIDEELYIKDGQKCFNFFNLLISRLWSFNCRCDPRNVTSLALLINNVVFILAEIHNMLKSYGIPQKLFPLQIDDV